MYGAVAAGELQNGRLGHQDHRLANTRTGVMNGGRNVSERKFERQPGGVGREPLDVERFGVGPERTGNARRRIPRAGMNLPPAQKRRQVEVPAQRGPAEGGFGSRKLDTALAA